MIKIIFLQIKLIIQQIKNIKTNISDNYKITILGN